MTNSANEQGVLAVLVERLEKQRLPRALAIKAKVDGGALLDDSDITFLEEVFADTANIKSLVVRHPEYEELAGKVTSLYREITERALANQEKAGPA